MANNWQYATLDAGERLSRIRAGETDIYNQEIARANQVIKDRQAVGLDISEQLAWIEKLDYVRVNKGSLTPEEINYNKKMGITATTAKPNVIQSNIQQSTNSNSNSSTINSSNIANLIKSINSNIPIATTSSNTTGNTTNTANTPNTPKAPNLIQSYAKNIVDKYNQELTEFKDNKQNRLDEYEAMLKKELGDKYNNFLDNSASNMLNYDSNIMKMFNANPAYAGVSVETGKPNNTMNFQEYSQWHKMDNISFEDIIKWQMQNSYNNIMTFSDYTKLTKEYDALMEKKIADIFKENTQTTFYDYNNGFAKYMENRGGGSNLLDTIKEVGDKLVAYIKKSALSDASPNIYFRNSPDNIFNEYKKIFSDTHYENNIKLPFNGYIRDQSKGNVVDVQMGLAYLGSNACGWVAAYNAFLELGKKVHPANIIRYIENKDGLLLDGNLGMNPAVYDKLFEAFGVKSSTTYSKANLDKLAQSGKSAILTYGYIGKDLWNSGAHNMTITWNSTKGTYSVYNGNDNKDFTSIYDFLSDTTNSNRIFISLTTIY